MILVTMHVTHLFEIQVWSISFEIFFSLVLYVNLLHRCVAVENTTSKEYFTSCSKMISEISLKHSRLHPKDRKAILTVVTFSCSSYIAKSLSSMCTV